MVIHEFSGGSSSYSIEVSLLRFDELRLLVNRFGTGGRCAAVVVLVDKIARDEEEDDEEEEEL